MHSGDRSISGTLQRTSGQPRSCVSTNSTAMNTAAIHRPGMILVVGMPRSGTTWLGRLLDSHPDTLLRHEPDTIDRGAYAFIPDGVTDADKEIARQHLHRMARNKSAKAAGRPPVFAKSYRGSVARAARAGAIYLAKTAEHYQVISSTRQTVPDFGSGYLPVIKSVGLGRAPLWASAMPSAKIIHLIRHPCGHVHSVMRGMDRGALPNTVHTGFAECEVARRYGLTRPYLEGCTRAEALAWRWVVLTQRAVEADLPLVCYEDLCRHPSEVIGTLFARCGLTPTEQTWRFLAASVSGQGSFFETRRDPLVAATAWQRDFAFAERVLDVVTKTNMRPYIDV
mgnify:CR=1 FL=1